MPQEIPVVELTCKKCGHTWKPRSNYVYRCANPKCQSFRWNEDDD